MTSLLAAGTLVALSASAPSTFDAAGYGAVGSFQTIGELDDIQGDIGRLYNLVTRNPLAMNGGRVIKKGNFTDGNLTLVIAVDYADGGQNLIRTAVASPNLYTFRITLPNGTIIYGQALVMGAPVNVGATESFLNSNVSLEIATSATGVGIVVV